MHSGFSMRGLNGVLAMLERAGEGKLRAAAADGIGEELYVLCEEAKALCPADTGALRDAIAVRLLPDGGEVFAGAPHAVYVEMGTAQSPAQPFLYPALRAGESGVLRGVHEAVGRQVRGI